MNPAAQSLPEVPCLSCGHPNAGDASRCAECGVPLDSFASTAPLETKMASAEKPASKDPVEPRTKPIVFWGVWLYFGPSAVGAGLVAYGSLSQILSGSPDGQALTGAIAIAFICGLYGFTSCWALWSVTAGYFKKR